jgi:hypothetical protein
MRIILFLALIICVEKLNAQVQEDPPFKRFSFQAGINISNMNFNMGEPPPATPVAASWKTGINIGLALYIPLAEKLFLQPEYFYTQRRGADGSLGIDYDADYLSLPVLLNYKLSSRFSLIAGPQVELLINAKSIYQGVSTNISHDVEERSIGITGGFEVEIIRSFFLSASYFQGLNHIGIGQRSEVKEFKYQVVNITAGIRF